MGRVIAIDGPVGAGKSTIARALARRLAFRYVDTGAMYRSVAWAAVQKGVSLSNEAAVAGLARELDIEFVPGPSGQRVLIDGGDATEAIRRPEMSEASSVVSAYPAVREAMVALQRRMGAARDVVMEGRDIGTVVFPDAEVKVYLDASLDERAGRRGMGGRATATSAPYTARNRVASSTSPGVPIAAIRPSASRTRRPQYIAARFRS